VEYGIRQNGRTDSSNRAGERTGDVLMLGFMNEEALAETQRSREVVFYSRSRNRLLEKRRVERARFESARSAGGL